MQRALLGLMYGLAFAGGLYAWGWSARYAMDHFGLSEMLIVSFFPVLVYFGWSIAGDEE